MYNSEDLNLVVTKIGFLIVFGWPTCAPKFSQVAQKDKGEKKHESLIAYLLEWLTRFVIWSAVPYSCTSTLIFALFRVNMKGVKLIHTFCKIIHGCLASWAAGHTIVCLGTYANNLFIR